METDIVWVTEVVTDYEYFATTTTIWVSEGFVAPTITSSTTSSSSTSTTSRAASSAETPAQFFEGGNRASTTSSSSVYVAPVPAYTPPAETSTSVPPVYVAPAPVPTTSSEAPVYVAPAPAATSTSAAYVAPAPVSTSSSGPSSGECSAGSPCEGDITYYEAGLGACGFTNDGSVDKIVALPHGLMGTQSNGNPYCGRMITVKCTSTGKTTTAKVMDKCMGCIGDSIDLSNAAFDEIADEAVGRTVAEWWFID